MARTWKLFYTTSPPCQGWGKGFSSRKKEFLQVEEEWCWSWARGSDGVMPVPSLWDWSGWGGCGQVELLVNIFACESLPLLYTFVINIAVTVCFLFSLLFPVNWSLPFVPSILLSSSVQGGRRESGRGSMQLAVWFGEPEQGSIKLGSTTPEPQQHLNTSTWICPKHQFQRLDIEPRAHHCTSLEEGQRNLKNLPLIHARMVSNGEVWFFSPAVSGSSLLNEQCTSR